ncbi:MAG: Coenzyme F420 hydrogenase/dehydrogenase, beta subunit C-terminal domain, partial [Promethearchaeota archaeon]
MEQNTTLIEILLTNTSKILKTEKYDAIGFENFINSLIEAENERQKIIKKIKEIGKIDIQQLKDELGIPERNLKLNIAYLKELGSLEFIGEKSQYFQEVIEKSKIKGVFPNVSIIRDDLMCSGCGICQSICLVDAIQFHDDTFEIDEDTCINCGLCYTCCPRTFFPKELKRSLKDTAPDLKFLEQLNYYRKICRAQTTDPQIKEVTQDGGIVTSLLITAFREKLIDAALAVGLSDEPLKPFPLLVLNEEELLQTAGTKYSNSHSLKILHDALTYKNVAVVGTSCMMEALQKIAFYPLNKPFYDNISLKIGLFCMESFDYKNLISFIKTEFYKQPEEIEKMDINKGRIYLFDKQNKMFDIPLKRIKNYGRFGCFFCDDLTAEQADISIGSIGSDFGWSTVIIRTEKGAKLFEKALNNQIIEKEEIKEDSKSFHLISTIAESKKKKYLEILRQKMIEQSPKDRTRNFKEVPKGYTSEMALLESNRCLQCGKPSCITGCPVNVDIPGFIRLIRKEKFREAAQKILETSSLPAVCGRVCPQESQCEGECLLGKRFKPIAIGNLERFVADYERNHRSFFMQKRKAPTGKKVAVLGCGPSSLTAAGDLIKLGYDVTIYEAFHKGGGVLAYGIPEFRLPKSIVDSEIEYIKSLGVNIEYNVIIGKTLTFDDLKAMGYSAIFIGIGAGLPMFLGIPGENLKGITSANEFLTRTNLMKAYRFPEYNTPIRIGKIVTVIGGGNVVLDSARTALRLGAEKVIVIYRRSEVEMPARKEEYHHALEEGVVFQFLTNPVRFIGDENDDLKQMEVIKM